MDPVGKLLADTWSLYKRRGAALTQIFVVPAALLLVVQLLAARGTAEAWALVPVVDFAAIVVSIVATIALISAAGRGTGFEASYRVGFSLFWPAVLLAVIHALTIIGGTALFIIPGIVFSIWFTFANYTLVFEGKRGIAAMLQSKAYADGYWWAVLGRMLLLVVLVALVMIVVSAPAAVIAGKTGGAIVYGILLLIIAPVSICYSYQVYENLVRLKPNVAELAAKETKALVITFMVVGIVAIIVLLALFGVFIGFVAKSVIERGGQFQYPSGYLPPTGQFPNGFPNPYAAPSGTYPETSATTSTPIPY